GGAELFTGNNLMVMAWASGRVRAAEVLRAWVLVYLGNLVGAVATAGLVFLAGAHLQGGGAVGAAALAIAQSEASLAFVPALARRPRHPARLPGGMALLQRAHARGQDSRDRPADRDLRGGRVRALRGEYVPDPLRALREARRRRLVLERQPERGR